MSPTGGNVDHAELARFEALAERWWDPEGEFKPLHQMNPVRMDYIRSHVGLEGSTVLDVGCGAGLLTEAMAADGAAVVGIDLAPALIETARVHAAHSGYNIDYRLTATEDLAATEAGRYDVVTCLEMLEHVPDPAAILTAIGQLVRPGGQVFLSTINRNLKSFLMAIVGAEYLMRMLPRGTHEYDKLIRPSEIDGWAREAGLSLKDVTGVHYNPLNGTFRLGGDVDVNYLVRLERPADMIENGGDD